MSTAFRNRLGHQRLKRRAGETVESRKNVDARNGVDGEPGPGDDEDAEAERGGGVKGADFGDDEAGQDAGGEADTVEDDDKGGGGGKGEVDGLHGERADLHDLLACDSTSCGEVCRVVRSRIRNTGTRSGKTFPCTGIGMGVRGKRSSRPGRRICAVVDAVA